MPINAQDQRDIRRYKLEFEHEKHNGSQIYSRVAVNENARTNPNYFYRAMSLREFESYRNKFRFDQGGGHQGWAPYRSYSLGYLKGDQTRLVEVYLPGFIDALAAEGWSRGKVEAGCISWGIGTAQSNGWRGSRNIRPRQRNQAQDPIEIFHDCLCKGGTANLVNLLAGP